MFKRIADGESQWSELFTPGDFFLRYKYYLMVTASSSSADLQLKWEGTVESKLRQLVMRLETVPEVAVAHPYVKGFSKTYKVQNDEERDQVSRGIVSPAIEERSKEISAPTDGKAPEEDSAAIKAQDQVEGTQTTWTTNFFIGLAIYPKDRACLVQLFFFLLFFSFIIIQLVPFLPFCVFFPLWCFGAWCNLGSSYHADLPCGTCSQQSWSAPTAQSVLLYPILHRHSQAMGPIRRECHEHFCATYQTVRRLGWRALY